ncbi:MAG: hypothetical protein VB106_01895 [Clostridiaceae bacterium]|nr:hypothetical protein [Clostridiaceae bacterium]
MIKSKKFVAILVVFVLSTILMTGCNPGTVEESGLGAEDSVNGQAVEEGQAAEEGQAETDSQADEDQTTVNGTIKAFDSNTGAITLITQNGDKLELKVTGESKILAGTDPVTPDQLTSIVGSEVSVEYQAETKAVTKINVKG